MSLEDLGLVDLSGDLSGDLSVETAADARFAVDQPVDDGPIYFDYNATTPVDPDVLELMLPLFSEQFANPASKHGPGEKAAALVAEARREVAKLAGTTPRSVVFCSGATEAANLAINGVLATALPERRRIVVGATEHPAVLEAAKAAAKAHGGSVDVAAVHPDGTIDLARLQSLLADDVALVAVMAANNETGALNDPGPVAIAAHAVGALYLCDVTQALGRVPVTLDRAGVDLAVASAHKLYGPKGIGALFAPRGVQSRLRPLLHGGGQEHGLRSGTVNVAGVVGFGAAARFGKATLATEASRVRWLTGLLVAMFTERLGPDVVRLNGPVERRLPNTANLRFVGVEADALLSCLPGLAISTGSACSSASADDDEPSHVLLAMGLTATAARESVRFSLGRPSTLAEVVSAVRQVMDAIEHIRQLAPAVRHADSSSQPTGPLPTGHALRASAT